MEREQSGWLKKTLLVLSASLAVIAGAGCAVPVPAMPATAALGNEMVKSADAAAKLDSTRVPQDSTPSPDGATIYFTALGAKGGIFRVPAAGGDAAEVAMGQPLVAPTGIAVSNDGKQLYVADAQAGKSGQILAVAASGGTPLLVRGTEGTAPRGLDVVSEGGQEMLYFTGQDPADGKIGVFKMPAAGGTAPTVVAKGAPFVDPDGIVVTKAGVAYVSDRSAAGSGSGSVFKIANGAVTKIVERVRTGNPAGVALTQDESLLLVSSLQPDKDNDQVLLVNLNSLKTGAVTAVVEQNQKAGGVHRARNGTVFSWCGVTSGGQGTVYRIEFK